MAVNSPRVLSWTNPTTYTDGTPYAQTDNAGYVIQLDSTPSVGIPVAWGTSFDLSTLAGYSVLKKGSHTVSLAVVSKDGVQSAFSSPATFPIIGTPTPPQNLAVA